MRLPIIRIVSCMLVAGALTCASVFAPGALAQGGARVVFSPSSAIVGEGTTTAVEVRVENVQGLYGLDIRIGFDPAVVEVVDADAGKTGIQVRPGSLLSVDFAIRNIVDNSQGTVWYALTQLNPSQPVSGSGIAFIVTFKGKSAGAVGPLTITYQKLVVQAGEAIDALVENGEIRVVGSAEAPPTPTTAPPPPQPTVSMPTAEPTEVQPTARPTDVPTLVPTTVPTKPGATAASSETARPTVVAPAATPTAEQGTVTRPPERTSTPTAIAPAASPAQPTPAQTAQAPVQLPSGDQGGLILRDILAGVAGVLVVAMMGGIAWIGVRARKARN